MFTQSAVPSPLTVHSLIEDGRFIILIDDVDDDCAGVALSATDGTVVFNL